MAAKKKTTAGNNVIDIRTPNFVEASIVLVGTAPFVYNKFSQEAANEMRENMLITDAAKKAKKKDRGIRDFKAQFEGSMHFCPEGKGGWYGIPATALKAALVRACSLVGLEMTFAKQALFIQQDGFDRDGVTPLVRVTKGEPEYFEACVRNANGTADIRARGRLPVGWEAKIRVLYDADVFTETQIGTLLLRAGMQVGIGAGRPLSSKSCGMGWGTFTIRQTAEAQAAE